MAKKCLSLTGKRRPRSSRSAALFRDTGAQSWSLAHYCESVGRSGSSARFWLGSCMVGQHRCYMNNVRVRQAYLLLIHLPYTSR